MDSIWKDLKYAIRMLTKKPGFTAVAVLSLAFGIGANTTIFTLIKAVFLQSVPVQDPARVVALFGTSDRDKTAGNQFGGISVPNLLDYRSNVNAFSAASLLFPTEIALDTSGKTVPVFAQLVNWDFFTAVGVPPTLGRGFTKAEDQGPHAVVVLSDRLWRAQFGARRDIVGQAIRLGAQYFKVVGIMPPEFHDVRARRSADDGRSGACTADCLRERCQPSARARDATPARSGDSPFTRSIAGKTDPAVVDGKPHAGIGRSSDGNSICKMGAASAFLAAARRKAEESRRLARSSCFRVYARAFASGDNPTQSGGAISQEWRRKGRGWGDKQGR